MPWNHSILSLDPLPGLSRLLERSVPLRPTPSLWGVCLLLVSTLASACYEVAPTDVQPDTGTCEAGAGCAVSGATAASSVVPSAAVEITPNAVSTTGIPMLILPAGLRTPVAMNNNHLVLGNGTSPTHGFNSPMLWSGGTTYQDLMPDRPYTGGAWGYDINNAGAVTGSGGASFAGLGFVLANGVLHRLPTPPNSDGSGFRGDALASDGTALVFYHRNSPGGSTGAVIKPPYTAADYTAIPLGDPGSTTLQHVIGTDVQAGLVTGLWSGNAWKWIPGESTLTLLPGIAADATNGPDIVGRARVDGVIHAAMLAGAVQDPPQDLGTLGGWSVPSDINADGWVAGYSLGPEGVERAFAWRPADGIMDLGTVDGHVRSEAYSIDDHGHVLGVSRPGSAPTSTPTMVIWFLPTGSNSAPEIQPIISQTATVGVPFTLEPVVTDAENDPYTLSWTGEVPTQAVINGIFSWTPTASDVGSYEITVTATQDSDPALFDSETFVLSVLPAAAPDADLQVTLVPDAAQRRSVGDAVAYTAIVHNAGPDPVIARLEVALQFRAHDQATWGDTPPNGVINGIFSHVLGELAAGQTVQVPFEALFHAFGTHNVTATVAGNHNDTDAANDAAVYAQVVDLPLTATGVEFGVLNVPGTHTSDGLPLAVVGVRVPAALVAGSEPGMPAVFVPTTLTPTSVLPGAQFLPGDFAAGDNFLPGNRPLPGGQFIAGDELLSGDQGAGYRPAGAASPGDHFIPSQALWVAGATRLIQGQQAAGRLLFKHGATTDLLVQQPGGTGLTIGGVGGGLLAVLGDGGSVDASTAFCANKFKARFGDGDAATFACGSLTVDALDGEVVIELPDGTTIMVRKGASIHIKEDGAGGFDIEILTGSEDDVTVIPPAGNSEPEADAGGPYVVRTGGSLAVDGGGSSDPDNDDLTFAWVLDDGSPTGIVAEGETTTLVAPDAAGLYALTLTVTDPSGATSSATVEVAVYDPDASSVTGGGWFHSPAGALRGNPAAEGRATFAFHLGYRKGKSVPDGHARLAFDAGDLRLTSDSFDWLVVSARMARFRGIGQIQGRTAPVLFEVVGRDPDGLRVRIWDDDDVMYDSGDVQIGGGRVIVKK